MSKLDQHRSINCTVVELKLITTEYLRQFAKSINCTVVELKLLYL